MHILFHTIKYKILHLFCHKFHSVSKTVLLPNEMCKKPLCCYIIMFQSLWTETQSTTLENISVKLSADWRLCSAIRRHWQLSVSLKALWLPHHRFRASYHQG